jgi:hypothetical protein
VAIDLGMAASRQAGGAGGADGVGVMFVTGGAA